MIAIVDYGVGNLRSVQKAFEKVGCAAYVTDSPERLRAARAVVLPGVGAFARAMENLRASGLDAAVTERIRARVPFLGICLGLQLLFEESEESFGDGVRPRGLGVLPGAVRRFPASQKVPQIGWNAVRQARPSPLWAGVTDGAYAYFVHSYYADPADPGVVSGVALYGFDFCAALSVGNVHAIQFHPEKSSQVGLQILANFGRLSSAG